MSLRSNLIKLAHEKPELRPQLLPLLNKEGAAADAKQFATLNVEAGKSKAHFTAYYDLGKLSTPKALQEIATSMMKGVQKLMERLYQEYEVGRLDMSRDPQFSAVSVSGGKLRVMVWGELQFKSYPASDTLQELIEPIATQYFKKVLFV